jgi:hypothetical protein
MYFVLVLFWYLDEGLRAVDFSIMKNPTASVGSEPANLGSRGQHANPSTTEAAAFEQTNLASEPPQTLALDGADTGVGNRRFIMRQHLRI